MNSSGIFHLYREPKAWLITFSIAVPIFLAFYFVMARLPGYESRACTIGGALTPINIGFSILLSILSAIMALGIWEMFKMSRFDRGNIVTGSSLGIGGAIGALTIFCTLCTIPVISVFGVAVSLSFFTTYNTFFKLLSLLFFTIGLWMLDDRLNQNCSRCKT